MVYGLRPRLHLACQPQAHPTSSGEETGLIKSGPIITAPAVTILRVRRDRLPKTEDHANWRDCRPERQFVPAQSWPRGQSVDASDTAGGTMGPHPIHDRN